MATLIIKEDKDLKIASKNKNVFKFIFKDEEKFKECITYKSGFNLLFYFCDSITPVIVGVKKLEECVLLNYDIDKKSCRIEGINEEFFNLSDTLKIRKYILDDFLDKLD